MGICVGGETSGIIVPGIAVCVGNGATTTVTAEAGVTGISVIAAGTVPPQPIITKIKINAKMMKILREEKIDVFMARITASRQERYFEYESHVDSVNTPISKERLR